jgi:RNA polymerase sigma-70 factor (ECF subfamily)
MTTTKSPIADRDFNLGPPFVRRLLLGKASGTSLSTHHEGHSGEQAESALIEMICDGKKELFYQLVQPYERSIYFAAFSILRNEADAEDVAQEAVLKALKNLKSFRREAKFSTWLVQITINEARMKLRKDRRSKYDSLDEGQDNEEGDYIPKDFADWREIPSEALQRKELKDALKRALDSLSPIYREVLIFRDVEHMSITDTAAALGISEANVKTRLLRARLQMRDALAPGYDGGWCIGDGSWKKVRPW